MALLGNTDFSELLAKNLDQDSLVSLCQDLLFRRGHTKIRRTDGPGDGGRDVFSVDLKGRSHLVQSKYHQKKDAVCSSADLSELPMALIKLGYSTGLFVTNSRISPQAKREYLDNYPGLELEFIDGDSLVATVVSDVLLQAVWFDGVSISQANAKLVFPLLIRRFPGDQPIKITSENAAAGLATLHSKHPTCRFALVVSNSDLREFELYRPPEPPNMSEGVMAVSNIVELHVEYGAEVSMASKLPKVICECLLQPLRVADSVLTMRVGQPWLLPLRTTDHAARVVTNLDGISFTIGPTETNEESVWFSCRTNDHWDGETDARATEAEFIRLYSHELDCALSYEINCNAGHEPPNLLDAFNDVSKKAWRKSVFCLLSNWGEAWPHSAPEPDQFSDWHGTGKMLCGWFHRNLRGGVIVLGKSEEPGFFEPPNEQEEDARLNELRTAITSINGVEMLDADKARHMVAAIADDPFPSRDTARFHTGELAEYLDELVSSPINPSSRRFAVTIAWKKCDLSEAQFEEVVMKAVAVTEVPSFKNAQVDKLDCYMAATIDYNPASLGLSSTHELLEQAYGATNLLIASIEHSLLLGKEARRCTKEYWLARWNVSLGTSWKNSGKAYAWKGLPNGDLKPMTPSEFFGGDIPD